MQKSLPAPGLSRRRFLYSTAIIGGSTVLSTKVLAGVKLKRLSPNQKLNIAIIGADGRGAADTKEVSSENIVALCDVNEKNLDAAAARYPQAQRYVDFRRLYDHDKDVDVVVVATTEHTHAFAVVPAIKLGKHVYGEAPPAHTG